MSDTTTLGKGPVLAVDLGGTQLRVAVFDEHDGVAHKTVVPTPLDAPESFVPMLRAEIASTSVTPEGAVMGVAGPISHAEGRAVKLPNLPRWEGHIEEQALADALGLPVLITNDADLAALGEHRYGAGQGVTDMVYVTVSTGVGGGVILNGELLSGLRSLAEIGFLTVDRETDATVQELAAGPVLARLAGMPGAEVTARATRGDEAALDLMTDAAQVVAIGVMDLVFCFMPQRVVIGGGVANAGDMLLEPIRQRIARHGPRLGITPEVVHARLDDSGGLLGGLALWRGLAEPPRYAHRLKPTFPRDV